MTDDDKPIKPDAGEAASTEGAEAPATGEPFDPIAALAELEAAMATADAKASSGSEEGGSDRYVAILENEVLELNKLLEAKEIALAQARGSAERAREEIDRAKERLSAESDKMLARSTRKVLVAFVDVFDDLERALASAREVDHNPEVVAGVEMVRRRFTTTLEGFGVRQMETLGQPFDPKLHEAISTMPVTAVEQDGRVAVVVREGYAYGDSELLRPASVVVGRKG
jgi:molecular chaperone GrpE